MKPHHVEHDLAILVGGRDVEEDELVRALRVVCDGRFDGIAGVLQVDEPDAFDDTPVLHVQTRDDPLREHQPRPAAIASGSATAPL
jgi:hypothetical protein